MSQWLNFFLEHWLLSATFLVLLILFLVSEFKAKLQSVPSVSAEEVVRLLNQEKATVLDIRDRADFAKGSLTHAKNIPSSMLEDKLKNLNLDKNQPVVIVGRDSTQMFQAGKLLKNLGFEKVSLLSGGIMAWENAELPLVKSR